MWKSLMSSRFASWVVGWVGVPKARQQQQELDLRRLYILTGIHKASAIGKPVNMQLLLHKSESLQPPEVKREVEAVLGEQVVRTAVTLHEELTKAGDPTLAAAGMAAAHQRLLRRREKEASGFTKLLRSVTVTTGASQTPPRRHPQPPPLTPGLSPAATSAAAEAGAPTLASSARCKDTADGRASPSVAPAAPAAAAAGGPSTSDMPPSSDSSASSSSSAPSTTSAFRHPAAGGAECGAAGPGGIATRDPRVSQAELARALQVQLGFRLELGPSSVPHQEAGTGLFLRGEARAGTVVAIFPGVLYGRTQLAHMPNFPKVDTDNPYLSCRYDQSIVDSKPWGRGDPGPAGAADEPPGVPGAVKSATSSSSSSPTSSGTSNSAESGNAASDTDTVHTWWTWAGPLSSALRHLEGRHPLALAHFVNHPGKGQEPNVLEAALDLPVGQLAPGSGSGCGDDGTPWVRAYVPSLQPPLQYDPCSLDEESDDDEEEDGDDDSAGPRRSPGELRPEELLTPPGGVVRLLVLVATRGIRDGEELLQNYRMNPHVVRPAWYVVHDAEAEERRWAKVKAIDLGFKRSKA